MTDVGAAGSGRTGFTLAEVLLVVVVLGLLAGIASGPIGEIRDRVRIQNGRHMVTAALATGRAVGPRWGRVSVLHLDSVLDEIRVVVDTGAVGAGDTLIVRTFGVAEDAGAELESNRSTFCFDARGIGTTGGVCDGTGGWIAVRTGDRADTLRITSVGRVR